MKQIPARDIQMFVGGAFALWGFRALIFLLSSLLAANHDSIWFARIISSIVTALALPLGVAVLIGKTRALSLIASYLRLVLALSVLAVILFFFILGPKALNSFWHGVPDLLVCIVLLWLISRSYSEGSRSKQ